MKREQLNHPWNLTLPRAAALQSELASYVRLTPLKEPAVIVAGADIAEWAGQIFAAVVVMDSSTGKVIEISHSHAFGRFSPIKGYMAFRHGPMLLKAIYQLDHSPELIFFSGHGVCHPRFLGLAAHLGLRLDQASIGCSAERLVGHYEVPGPKRGDHTVIRFSPQAPGAVLRTQPGVNPLFVSPGHRIDLMGAISETLRLASKFRFPEPLRRAHIEAGRYMREFRDKAKVTSAAGSKPR